MGWLIRYEAYPELFTSSVPGYRALLDSDLMVLDSWWKISFKGVPVGYSHSWVNVQEDNPVEHYVVENSTILQLNVMGFAQRISMSVQASLDVGYQLQRFDCFTRAGQYRTDFSGARVQGDHFRGKPGGVFFGCDQSRAAFRGELG